MWNGLPDPCLADATICPADQICIPSPKNCITQPCPQHECLPEDYGLTETEEGESEPEPETTSTQAPKVTKAPTDNANVDAAAAIGAPAGNSAADRRQSWMVAVLMAVCVMTLWR